MRFEVCEITLRNRKKEQFSVDATWRSPPPVALRIAHQFGQSERTGRRTASRVEPGLKRRGTLRAPQLGSVTLVKAGDGQ